MKSKLTKFWAGIKLAIGALILIYVLVFVAENNRNLASFWYWYDHVHQTTALLLSLWAFIAGVVMTFVVRMVFGTIRQIAGMRQRANLARLAHQEASAGRLQTKPEAPAQP